MKIIHKNRQTEYKTALVTGASGFIGEHFLPRLRSEFPDISIHIGTRQPDPANPVGEMGISRFMMDLPFRIETDVAPDIIFHMAGEKQDESKMWETNLEGTRKLLEWSISQKTRRFVYLSSVGVYGAQKNAGVITEEADKNPNNKYEKSKSAAEDLVRSVCERVGMEYIILQPSNVIGISLKQPGRPFLGMMKTVKQRLFTYFDDGTACLNYVSVEDVAAAVVTGALTRTNAQFILNTPISIKQAVEWIADEIGVSPPDRRWPGVLGFLAGEIASDFSKLTGKSIPFSRERYRELTNTTRYDGSAITATTEFRYSTGLETTIRRLVRHYRTQGML